MNQPYIQFAQRGLVALRNSLSVVWLIVIAGYLSVMTAEAIYRNYQSQERLDTLEQQLEASQQEQQRLQALAVYYQSKSFREQELRRTLLLKFPEETVYALPESSLVRTDVIQEKPADARLSQAYWRQWFAYLQGK